MTLYPTETVYGLGVNALDGDELARLYTLKGRDAAKSVSWLVRDIHDIERYAHVSERARRIAAHLLPGSLTLVLPVRTEMLPQGVRMSDTIGFRISTDPTAQQLIHEFMAQHAAPLTCTSANVSGMPTLSDPEAICAQFGVRASMIDTILDDGPRAGTPTTVVEVRGEDIRILRPGAIGEDVLLSV